MENIADVLDQGFEHHFLKDFKPKVLAVYEKRVQYHNKLSDLLRNSMVEVSAEVAQTVGSEDEDEKEEQEQKQKQEQEQEEKKIYELENIYRTVEKRLSNKQTPDYVANSFGFIEKVGEGKDIFIHAIYDPTLDAGTVTIRLDAKVLREIKSSLADIEARPTPFDFYIQGIKHIALLSADVQKQSFGLNVADVPYYQIKAVND